MWEIRYIFFGALVVLIVLVLGPACMRFGQWIGAQITRKPPPESEPPKREVRK